MFRFSRQTLALVALFSVIACTPAGQSHLDEYDSTPAGAEAFLAAAEGRLLDLLLELSRAQWVQQTHITGDTEALAALAYERFIEAQMQYAKQATSHKTPKPISRQ